MSQNKGSKEIGKSQGHIRIYNVNHEKYISTREALFLAQVHYWTGKSGRIVDGKKWIYNSYKAWRGLDNFPNWSINTIIRVVKKLKKLQLIETNCRLSSSKSNWTTWYSINYDHPILKEYPFKRGAQNGQARVPKMDGRGTQNGQVVVPKMSSRGTQNGLIRTVHNTEDNQKESSSNHGDIDDDGEEDFSSKGGSQKNDNEPFNEKPICDAADLECIADFENTDPAVLKDLSSAHAVLPPSREELKRLYGNIPKAVELNKPRRDGTSKESYDLRRYMMPFTGSGKEISKAVGFDVDGPEPFTGWDSQFQLYFDACIRCHWSVGADPPGGGFKRAFRRAAMCGVLYRCGFQPLTPQQLDKIEREEAAKQKEAQKRAAEQARKEEERARQKEKEFAEKLTTAQELYARLCEEDQRYHDENFNYSGMSRDSYLIDQIPQMKRMAKGYEFDKSYNLLI